MNVCSIEWTIKQVIFDQIECYLSRNRETSGFDQFTKFASVQFATLLFAEDGSDEVGRMLSL